jgi:site-specific DNA recombinase
MDFMGRNGTITACSPKKVARLNPQKSAIVRCSAIESGVADLDDGTLKDRVAAVKTERDLAQIAYDRAVAETNPRARITDEKISKFVETMRSNVLSGDTPFRRAYIRSVIDQVEVDDDEIRIWGRKRVLERLVAASGGSPAGVPSFVRKWRARRDSNS